MQDDDVLVPAGPLLDFAERYLAAMGCEAAVASEVAGHLVDADLKGVNSHGTFRLVQYAQEARDGVFDPGATAVLTTAQGGGPLVDGNNGFGMPAMRLAVDEASARASAHGSSAVGVANVAHTGRIGAFAERAAEARCLTIICGGGARADWRQVAPFGGAKAVLPTNPYAFGIPAGEAGPVVLDFATSAGAGGKIYAAHMAGRALPEGMCIDANGVPTSDPADYINGGALLPMAGPKGYGMALVAELLGEAILGEAMSGMNWICVCIDLKQFREESSYNRAAGECLTELRDCPPADGFDKVEIPGERERQLKAQRLETGIPMAPNTVSALKQAAGEQGLESCDLGCFDGL